MTPTPTDGGAADAETNVAESGNTSGDASGANVPGKHLHEITVDGMKRALIVYCEKFWFHRDDLWLYEKENSCTVRPMLVPFQLR